MENPHATSGTSVVTARARTYFVEPFYDAWLVSIAAEYGVQVVHFMDTEEEAHAKAHEILAVHDE